MADQDQESSVQSLVDMFGSLVTRDVIQTILQSCGGDVQLAIDGILELTTVLEKSDAPIPQEAERPLSSSGLANVAASQNVDKKDWIHVQELHKRDISYATASQRAASAPQVATGAIKKTTERESRPPARNNKLKELSDQLQRIVEYHVSGYRTLVLMRGVPGSGKSTLARQIVEVTVGPSPVNFKAHIFSSDDFFLRQGFYAYDVSRLGEAHEWNQASVRKSASCGLSPIVVDNTHVQCWEMQPYVRAAIENGYFVEIVEPNTSWAKKAAQLVKKTTHNVPYGKIIKMLDLYEDHHSARQVIDDSQLSYPPHLVPPVKRTCPPLSYPLDKTSQFTSATTAATETQIVTAISGLAVVQSYDVPSSSQRPATSGTTLRDTSFQNDQNVENQGRSRLKPAQDFEEFEKLSHEWENGPAWLEQEKPKETVSQHSTDDSVSTDNPKPQRDVVRSREHSRSRSTSRPLLTTTMVDVVQGMTDWGMISNSVPAWDHDAVANIEEPNSTRSVEKTNSETSVESGDYCVVDSMFRVITAKPRDINFNYIQPAAIKIPHMRMLDKGSTTADVFDESLYRCKNEDKHFLAFRKMFKRIPEAELRDIFDKCGGNANWASEVLLDGIPNYTPGPPTDEDSESDSEEDDHDCSAEMCNCISTYNIVPRASETISTSVGTAPVALVTPNIKKKKDKTLSESSMQVIRQIEQSVNIPDYHYSNHCLKIKKSRHGEAPLEMGACGESSAGAAMQTAHVNSDTHYSVQPSTSTAELTTSASDEDSCSDEGEQTVNFRFGMDTIQALVLMYEGRHVTYPEHIVPVVSIKKAHLDNFYAIWMESLTHQDEIQTEYTNILIKEDEQMARQLSQMEAELEETGREPEVPDFREIMDMDLALTLYNRDVSEWKSREPTDMAARLSRDKLHNLFPTMEPEVLSEVLLAHDNNFQDTVEGLLVSTGQAEILQKKNGINKFVMEKEMQRQQEALEEEHQKELEQEEWPVLSGGPEEAHMETVKQYREEAQRHLVKRNYNHNKAQEYMNRGMTQVASHYAEMAAFHKKKCEQANSLAATSLIQVHAAKKTSNLTLDLHFLFVAEALQTLDLFLDHHIQLLQSTDAGAVRWNDLFLITGRGVHSQGGPRIKPAVKKRLKQRGLLCSHTNPGLLKVRITADNKLTHQIE